MSRLAFVSLSLAAAPVVLAPVALAAPPPYLDPALPVETRAEDLLRRMTIEEKVGQMNMPCVYEDALGGSDAEKTDGVRRFAAGTHLAGLGPGGGFFTLPNTVLHEGTRQQVEFVNELQRIAARTRLGVPLLMTEEGTHGLMCAGATIFPEGPALGSTWDLDLVSRVYRAAAAEARAIGMHQIFTLVVEPARDPRLGRNQEAYSEDPWLCARLAEAVVRAVQGQDVSAPDHCVAGLCHYPGQSEPYSGLERGAMEVSERKLRSVFLPPWEAGVRDAGALGVMATYPAIDGVPTHASARILTDILRGELRFDGLVLSEGGGISTLVYEGVARDQKEAGQLALRAGVDVGISYEPGYMLDLLASVREGLVPEALVDRAVRRILRQKIRLGLFERCQADLERALSTVHSPDHRQTALDAAREAIVLLKNEGGLLPLDRERVHSIAVVGPNADDARNQLGDYTANTVLQEVVTILEGVRRAAPRATVTHVRGCDVTKGGREEIEKAAQAAARADVAIVVVGENEWRARRGDERTGTSGEGFDAATLELTGRQEDLVRAVAGAGKPTVVVLVNGRPLAVRWIAEHVPAIVEAWIPGERGGEAVAEVLFGDTNPSGRLPITIPRHAGQLPVVYSQPPSKAYWLKKGWGVRYVDLDPAPLFPFGHGLSYTRFDYANLRLGSNEITPDGTQEVSVDVRNTGSRPGRETVQLYVRNVVSSVTTPVMQLRGFRKVALDPGAGATVVFRLTPADLSLWNARLERVVEPGEFEVMVGASSADIRLTGAFTVRPRQR
ncbi:MAG TPA: glycoside hydrolase family 3 C-terminal domain-containing protein [Vicinamibacteria bacterium]|nr:glycoside hydrolase family 3 C-terminal domain-containing protein [Vicinamibacteria bacterium]